MKAMRTFKTAIENLLDYNKTTFFANKLLNALDYCEQNGVNFTKEQLTKIVNLIVAIANLIKKFIVK